MFVSRVGATKLSSQRLDADFYRPEFLENEAKLLIKKVAKLGDVGHFFAGPFGSLLPSNLYLDEGVPLFRVGNVGQFEVLTDNFAHLAPHVHNELKASEVRPGDLLVVKASVGEKICKVPDWIPKADITQHIIGIRPNGTFDTDYVSAFLFSNFGVLQLQRYSLGSIIQYLGITDAKGTYIVKADSVAQKYIGDKVRQAERLRVLSKQLSSELENAINTVFAGNPKPNKAQRNYVSCEILTEKRLDGEFYAPQALWAEREIKESKYGYAALGELASRIKDGPGGWGVSTNGYQAIGIPVIRSVNIVDGECNLSDCVFISENKHRELISHEVKLGSVLLSVRGTVGRAAVFNDRHYRTANLNAAVVTVDCKEIVNPYYLAAFLNSPIGRVQTNRIANGAVQMNMNLTETASNLIVTPPMIVQEEIANIYRAKIEAKSLAQNLIKVAKSLVEALIEGQLTEAELIAAEQALQAGNDQADRQILNRLKTDGVDGQGQPLFSDLDQLYSLLQQADHS